ncbi:MAG TPA: glycosyltransferase family 39 protein [Opitutaceae bacterium]
MNRRLTYLAAAGLLALYWWMATSISDTEGVVGDEIAHLTAGYSYWKFDDYRLQPENGNLPQRWAALPLLARRDLKFPTLDQAAWRISDVWEMGFRWFYDLGNDLEGMLRDGRRMIALLGVAAGALVFMWSRRLHGNAAALLATALFAFSPTMLANGALITSDMASTCMFFAAVTAFWAMVRRLDAGRWLLFSVVLGLVCVAKFSAPLIAPMCAIIFAARLAAGEPLNVGWPAPRTIAGRLRIGVVLGGATVASCAVAIAIIWAFYGFHYAMFRHFEPNHVRMLVGWDILESPGGPVVATIRFVRDHHLLPESYTYGFAHTWRYTLYRKGFLNGDYRSTGWIQFFPYTVSVKTPIALFGILALAVLAVFARRRTSAEWRARLYAWTPLLALFGVYWAFSLTSHLNIGHRHITPIYPVLFVMASGAAAWITRPLRWTAGLLAALVVWFAGESIWIRPHYLAYFNEFVGPTDAWKHLVDSSLDWGQDLPSVHRWLNEHPQKGPVFISYFGSCDLVYYKVNATRIGDANFDIRQRKAPHVLGGGLWIISMTQFQQDYTEARGPWDAEKEARYHQLLDQMVRYAHEHKAMSEKEGNTFEEYQFARLCHYLRTKKPIDEINYTFLLFQLTDDEVTQALYGPVSLK